MKLTGFKAISIIAGFSSIIAGKTPQMPYKVGDTEWVAEEPSRGEVQTTEILKYEPINKGWMSVFGPKNGPDGICSMSASNGENPNEIILSNHTSQKKTYRAKDSSSSTTTPWLKKEIAPGTQHAIRVKGSEVCVEILKD